ncbi:hypothetical protein HDU93_002287 [Gonapodya sp. JEL0774]|nr:hypothetical protein HDU93_002287 [Gonapodya sp. JEL0774]
MALATIEVLLELAPHPNADTLDLATVLGYTCIVKRGTFNVGEKVILIQPDTVLPDAPWAVVYKSKSTRVKAVRLRGEWSFGIVEKIATCLPDYAGPTDEGTDVTEILGVTKYEAPVADANANGDMTARGGLPFSIPKTDEERYQSLKRRLPYGELVDVTLKVDGQSWTAYAKLLPDGEVATGVTGRSVDFDTEADNAYTRIARKYRVLEKLKNYALRVGKSLAIRGESYGGGIQKLKHNPHTNLAPDLAIFSVYLIDERRYANKGHPLYFTEVARELGLPTVPILAKDVPLTLELCKHYDEEIDKIDGKAFEGVVMKHAKGSFKVINKANDSKK